LWVITSITAAIIMITAKSWTIRSDGLNVDEPLNTEGNWEIKRNNWLFNGFI
jgi:hypothetical protein